MSRFGIRDGARLAVAAGLGLALTLGAAPVVALAEGETTPVIQRDHNGAIDISAAQEPVADSSYALLADTADAEGDDAEEPAQTDSLFQVGDAAYTTLKEAAQQAEAGATIKLLGNATTERVIFDQDVVLDLGGYTLTLEQAADSDSAFCLDFEGGSSTIRNGIIVDARSEGNTTAGFVAVHAKGRSTSLSVVGVAVKSFAPQSTSNYNYGLRADDGASLILNAGTSYAEILPDGFEYEESSYGTCGVAILGSGGDETSSVDPETATELTVNEGVSITATGFAISGNGKAHNTVITVNGGSVVSECAQAIYHPQYGELNVTGGTISGNTGIEMRSGILTVTEGIISGGDGSPGYSPNGNGSTTDNTGIAVAQHTTGKPITVTITGGTVSGGAAVFESNPQNNQDDDSVNVTIRDAELDGNLISDGFGDVDVTNTTVNGDVFKTGTGSMGVTRSTITGNVRKGEDNSGTIGFVNSEIRGEEAPEDTGDNGVTYVKSTVNGEERDTAVSGSEAMVGGTRYATLEAAVAAAKDGDTVTLLNDVVLDGTGKVNTEGILTITEDITLEGNGRTVTAEKVKVGEDGTSGPSMINIQGGASVTVRDLTIDGEDMDGSADGTKHGLNVYGEGTSVTVENVTCRNGNGYGVVINGAEATISGLTTSGNGWGGVNVDSKSGRASLVIDNSNINEKTSIKIENGSRDSNDDPSVEIKGGTYRHVTKGDEIGTPNLTISGGTFDTGALEGAVNPGDYVAGGLVWDVSTGTVVKKPEPSVPSVPSTPSAPTYDVEVPEAEGGKVAVSDASPEEGDEVTVTATPDEGQEVREVSVTDAEGNAVEVTPNEDGTWMFEMPKGDVTVEVTFGCDGGELCPTHSYADLDQAEWYHDAVDWAVTSGAILGYGDGTFGPGRSLARAEMATILCRLAGEPEADLSSLPSDVPASEWYANGVAWSLAEGVFNGNGDGSFDPAGAITREQAACVLFNRAQAAGEDVSARADLSAFSDAGDLSGWAEEAMSWAVAEGVFSGGAAGLEPGRALTRSEGAAILWNWETRAE